MQQKSLMTAGREAPGSCGPREADLPGGPAPQPLQRMRVAVLDDDHDQLDLGRRIVESLGHDCVLFERGEALMKALRRDSFDLLVIDWQLPDVSGIDVIKWVRAHIELAVPIIIVTNRADERDVVTGLTSGADDYMTKPLRVMELTARLRALLRRSYPSQHRSVQRYGAYEFDMLRREARFEGQPIELKNREFDLACCLFAHRGRLLSRNYLRETIWGSKADTSSRSLDTHISALRTKLGLGPERGYRLTSIYGHGYRMESLAEPGGDE